MNNYDWDFSFLLKYRHAFFVGMGITLFVSILSFAWGTIAGYFWGIRLYKMARPFQKIFIFINDSIRAIPLLLIIFIIYYFPTKELLNISSFDSITTSILAIGLSQLVYTADIVISAIKNVSTKNIQAAEALGLSDKDVWRSIIFPDLVRQILPAQIAFFIGIVRLSSLAAIIGTQDIFYVAKTATTQNYRTIEALIVIAIIYIIIILPFTYYGRWLEKSKWIKRRW